MEEALAPENLTGAQKVAVLLMALGPEKAGEVTKGFTPEAREALGRARGPQKAMMVLRRVESQLQDGGGFRTLRQADPEQLSTVLRNEHPQVIALILAHLPAEHTAAALNRLPAALGSDVLFRIARMEKVLPDVLQAIEQALGTESMLSLSSDMSLAGGPAAVAAVLNLVPATVERDLLEGLIARDQALADEIKNLMFVFD